MQLNQIEELMECTLDRMRGMIDINSIVGSPINSGTTTIIPISRVGFGFVSGGGEYSESLPKVNENMPYAGGSGGGVSIKPLGFLVIDRDGSKYISIDEEEADGSWKDLIKASINVLKK